MRAISLQSGSNGNCIYVEAGGARLLVDAGISGRQAAVRLASCGVDIASVDAVIVTHDHADHVRSVGVYQRKFGFPIRVTDRTLAAAGRDRLGKLTDVRPFQAGRAIELDGVRIETIPTPHDGADGVVLVIDDGERRLGVLTDLGHPFEGLGELIATLDGVFLESNYDPQMLANGPYPAFLQRRIRGDGGHLSNAEAAALLASSAGRKLKWACLAHLSEKNNTPALAEGTACSAVGGALPIRLASRYGVGEVLAL